MIKHSQQVSEYELPIKIEPQKDGKFVATSPNWKDCYAQGETIEEAILEITAVAQSLIELYKEEGLKIPLKAYKDSSLLDSFKIPILVAA